MKARMIFEEPILEQNTNMQPKPLEYEINETTGCWNVVSHAVGNRNYPVIKRANKKWCTHRYSYFLTNGQIPKGQVVRHKCDNVMCINPDHLELGTQKDNNIDAFKRNRCKKKILSDADVRAIKVSNLGCVRLAKKYDVAESYIVRIRNGSRRQHVI